MQANRQQLRTARNNGNCAVAYIPGLGRVIGIKLQGIVHLWKCSRKIGEWKNREAYNQACDIVRTKLA